MIFSNRSRAVAALYKFQILIGLLPWLFIVLFFVFRIHSIIYLGYIPFYNNPDPKILPFYLDYHAFLGLGFTSVLFSFSMWLPLVLLILILHQTNTHWKKIFMGSAGFLIVIDILFGFSLLQFFLLAYFILNYREQKLKMALCCFLYLIFFVLTIGGFEWYTDSTRLVLGIL